MVNFKQPLNTRYELKQLLGSGGMARVYLAEDSKTNQLVAVKILHPHLAENDLICARFKREAAVLANLSHPNIIRIHDYDVTKVDDEIISYIVMDYLSGKSLQDVLVTCQQHQDFLSSPRILQTLNDVASALDYAHAQNTIHRDIKPSNIMFSEEGQAILMDFGLARIIEDSPLTQENTTLGTPAYMSPEQIRGDKVTAQADLYSLGILFYEMATGSLPYQDQDAISVLLKHLNSPIPTLASDSMIGVAFNPILTKALAKAPHERYEDAQSFVADVRRSYALLESGISIDVLQTMVSIPAPTSITPPAVQPSRMRRLWIIAGGILLVMGILGFLFIANRQPAVEVWTDADYITDFDDPNVLREWMPFSSSRVETSLADGVYRVTNLIPNSAIHSVVLSRIYENDTSLLLEATLTQGDPASAYGIVFNYQDEENFGVFAVDGMGRFSVWQLVEGRWNELRDKEEEWTAHPNINFAGEANDLRLEISYNGLMGFVNNRLAFSISSSDGSNGKVGFYVASTMSDTTPTQIDLENFEALAVTRSMTAP